MTVNWNNIRLHQGSQDQGFEELCCQLFRHKRPLNEAGFERRGYRDAGIECAHVLRDGTLLGMQAKYFTRSPLEDDWRQVDKSVQTAIAKNPQLRHLTICIPQNFDDPKIAGQKSAMDKWKEHKSKWEQIATEAGQQVTFELWGDTELTDQLTRGENRGKLWYFFNQEELTPEWFKQRVDDAAKNAGQRYTEELHVELPISQLFEGLGRTGRFVRPFREQQGELNLLLPRLIDANNPESALPILEDISQLGSQLRTLLENSDLSGTAPLHLKKMVSLADALRESAHNGRSIVEVANAEAQAKALRERDPAQGGYVSSKPPHDDLQQFLWNVAAAAHKLYELAKSDQAKLANNPVLIVSGSAGKGKTHLLVDLAKRRTSEGLPTLVLFGENFRDGVDPLAQIIQMVGLERSPEVFLQALEAAAEDGQGRFLLLIDALNEGEGKLLWRKKLAGLINTLRRYPRIGVALSIRTTYEDVVLPEGVREEVVCVTHEGFASRGEVATRAFFSYYGLHLPRIPLLNPEFNNPLFLKLFCKGLQSQGLHEIPEGYEGITRIFDFLVEATDKKLRRENSINVGPHEHPVQEYLDRIADMLALSGMDTLPMATADRISREIMPGNGYDRTLLNLLLTEGILAREMLPAKVGEVHQEGIRFAYQRFSDHEVVRRLLALHCPEGIGEAFSPQGAIGCLFTENYHFYQNKGWLEALAIQVPERFGQEITDVLPLSVDEAELWARNHSLAECLIESLLWRRKETITAATFVALEALKIDKGLYDRYLDVLLTLAAVPAHPLNAERLHAILLKIPFAQRDEFWTQWLHWNHEGGAVDRLITWGLLPEDKTHLTDEAVLLVCVALAWLTVTTRHQVRDRATKSLVRLLTPRPHLVATLLDKFIEVDDLYIIERLYAMAYGVAMRLRDRQALTDLAEAIYHRLFASRPVIAHIMIRDYGRCILERALNYGCSLSFDIERARPPYGSDLPSDPPTRDYFENLAKSLPHRTDEGRATSELVERFGSPDVSDYYGGPSFRNPKFSAVLLSEPVPLSRRQKEDAWEESLTSEQIVHWERVRKLAYTDVQVAIHADSEDHFDDSENSVNEGEAVTYAKIPGSEKSSKFDRAFAKFGKTLSETQRGILQTILRMPPRDSENQIAVLPDDLFARWVIERALSLGWTAERFATFDRRITEGKEGRGVHRIDTLGAKYLWIAYYEIYARLADHYYLLTDYGLSPEATPYQGSWFHDLRTIDPSLIPNEATSTKPTDQASNEWWCSSNYNLNDVREGHDEWLQNKDDMPSIAELLIMKDKDSVEWVVLEFYPKWKQKENPEESRYSRPYRYFWLQMRGYLVKKQDRVALFDWMKAENFMNRWMPEGDRFTEIFLGEFYGSPAWDRFSIDSSSLNEKWQKPGHDCPVPLASVQSQYTQFDDDTAPTPSCQIMLPSSLLACEAGIVWSGEGGDWIDGRGEIVLQDPSAREGGYGTLLIRRDFLDQFLHAKGYDLVWTFLGEKLVINWGKRHPRLSITGCGYYTPTQPTAEIRCEYKGHAQG